MDRTLQLTVDLSNLPESKCTLLPVHQLFKSIIADELMGVKDRFYMN